MAEKGHPKNNFETIIDGKSYWISRSLTVVGFVFGKNKDGKWCVLANKRGVGCPSNHHKWNCPCGYLDYGEDLKMAVSREVFEETGVKIEPHKFNFGQINSYANGDTNVSVLFYTTVSGNVEDILLTDENSEPNEVEDIKWIPVDEVKNYKWSYNHTTYVDKYLGKIIFEPMKKYEFTVFTIQKGNNYEKVIAALNEYGKGGWELKEMFDRDMVYVCCMQREIPKEVSEPEKIQMLCD